VTPEEVEAECLALLQSMMHISDNNVLYAILVTIRWAFGKDRSMHEWAVYSFCNGRLVWDR
jgi:hypothetical protein